MSGERLLTISELLEVLRMGRSWFYEHQASLKARGLQEVKVGRRRLFRQASVDRLIRNAAERGKPLC